MANNNETKWAPVQLEAIKSRNENLLVSASAGSGKTTVMIGRILDLIEHDNASLDKMLICTFTRASAADMKEKLYKKLLEKRNASTDPQKYDKQLSLIPIADISTIDSWCVKLVRNYFYAIDADPAFEILDKKESDAMLMQAIESVLAEFLSEENNEAFTVLYESMYKNRSDKEFKKLIAKVYSFVMTQAEPEKWLSNAFNYYDGSYGKILDEMLDNEERVCLAKCDEMIAKLSYPGVEKAQKAVQSMVDAIRGVDKLSNLNNKNVDFITQVELKKLSARVKALIKKREERGEDNALDTSYGKQIAKFTLAVMRTFEAEKERKAVMDFVDCEHKAYAILARADICEDVRAKYDYVFEDEYQDTNPLQEAIISRLKKDGNMFFVGDIKQSIYAFRNCDPAIFGNLYDNYEKYGFAKPIDFVTNYRCGQKIIDFVNSVFVPLMTRDFGGVDYSAYQLQGYSDTSEGEVRATVFKPSKKADSVDCDYELDCEEDASKVEKLAETILFDVSQTLNKIKKNGEKATFSDIAILTPKRNPLTYVLYEKMKERDMPVHISQELYLSSNPTIRYVLDILTFLDDNENDIAFVSAVTSQYFGITAQDVVTLCKKRKKGESLAWTARKHLKRESDELSQKLTHVFEFFDKYSTLSMFVPVKETVSSVIVDIDYFDLIIRTKGIREADVLSMFLDSLNDCPYADTLDSYLKFVSDGGDKCEIKPEDNCINIMTIHASKGLEFPYVFLVNTDAQKSNNETKLCLMDKDLGLAIKSIDAENKTCETNPFYDLLNEISEKRIKEEKARLLYVALTRPQEGLYIYASENETKKDNFYDGYPSASDSLFGWMSAAIIKLGYTEVDADDVEISEIAKKEPVDLSRADASFVEALRDRFEAMDRIYANKPDVGLKTSVTQIASEEAEGELPPVDEERVRKSKDDPLKKGNAYHKTMELLDFSLDFDSAYATAIGKVMDSELVDKDKIRKAYDNVKPLLDNAKAYKEKSFIYNDGARLVQGIIDLLIIKDGVATVVDYKTTSAYSLSLDKTMEEYRIQVGIYAEAVREIIGIPVDKVMLYSFERDDFIEL